MKIVVADNANELGKLAGQTAAKLIREVIAENGQVNIVLATGTSQLEMLNQLIAEDIEWDKVTLFHLDEYIGLPESSPASFRRFLRERFLEKVPPLKACHLINGEGDAAAECERLNKIMGEHPIDVTFVGVGENGHLAFNDPPADFDTEQPYVIVTLDDRCRRQQYQEGWFKSVADVPPQAISMSVRQVYKSRHIICSVPDGRKAQAVKDCLENPVSNMFPAGILKLHGDCTFFLDKQSSALLTQPVDLNPQKNNPRRDFIRNSIATAAGLAIAPGIVFKRGANMAPAGETAAPGLNGLHGLKTVAFICNTYWNLSHADVIGTKLFAGLPTDEGMIRPEVKIVSMWIDQIEANDTGVRIAKMNGTVLYPTIAEALTLGGDKLAVDGVIYIGEHGHYPENRFGEPMYPRLNYLEQIFRVFDASNKSVPVYNDKHLAYSWLDSKWVYDRAKELKVPMMAGSSIPYCWRDPAFEHPIGTKITEAVAIGFSGLTSYGFHACEMLQCMVERRSGGETGVASVQGLTGDAVWEAMDSGKISEKLVLAACNNIRGKVTGSLRELVREPKGVIIQYNVGLKGAVLLLEEYVNAHWAYAAVADGKTVGTEFVIDEPSMLHSHFSYLALNIEKLITTGRPAAPIERTLLTSGIMDIGVRSIAEGGVVKETPFLNIHYTAEGFHPIRPTHLRPTGQSLGPWPPKGYEFTIPDSFKKKP